LIFEIADDPVPLDDEGNIDLTNLAAVPQRFMSGERR